MSYILEALKKSQAERQLGELPSIHAPQVQLQGAATAGGAGRLPAWLALGGVGVAVAAVLLWWQPWQGAAPVLTAAAPAAVPVAAPAATPSVAATLPAPAAETAVPARLPAPAAAPLAVSASAVASAAAAPAPAAAAPAPLPATQAEAKREAAPAPVLAAVPPAAVPAAAPPVQATDEPVPGMRDLPEPIQRQIPPVAIGGYIYSKNPADRLLLIDKVLRHEGEELAPGLVLEKLQPKAAIFSFKGYRYRVPY